MATSPHQWRRPLVNWRPLHRALYLALLSLLVLVSSTGCASYTDRIHKAQRFVADGEPDGALEIINKQLRVDSHQEMPDDLKGVQILLLMERALLLQARGEFEASARDLIAADEHLEWLTIRGARGAELMRFLYSDDAGQYKAPPHERLLVNIFNMINFLAADELGSARVEARRFDLLQTYFLDEDLRELLPAILGLGNYLAGAAFEASREYEEAARFYTGAKIQGIWPEDDEARLLDLIALTGYQGSGLGDLRPQAQPLLERAKERPRLKRADYQETYQRGDVLLVVQTGLAPFRRAERIPLGAALSHSAYSPYGSVYLDHSTRNQALILQSQGVLNWINLPVLTRQGLPPRRSVRVYLPGRLLRLADPISIADQVQESWKIVDATVMAAAISRAVVRALAGEGSRVATDMIAQEAGAEPLTAGLLSWLVSLALRGSMAAADTPDTRSWTALPAEIHLLRQQLEPGVQTIELEIDSKIERFEFELLPHHLRLINASRLR